jgi:hypothetical protein
MLHLLLCPSSLEQVLAHEWSHNILYSLFSMLKSGPIKNGNFVIVVCGENKGQAAIVTHMINAMADAIFPLRDVQKTLRLTQQIQVISNSLFLKHTFIALIKLLGIGLCPKLVLLFPTNTVNVDSASLKDT